MASLWTLVKQSCVATALLAATTNVIAATNFDGGGSSNWWFDPDNWSKGPYLPPAQLASDGVTIEATDVQINDGSGAWDMTGEGVVYDPANDPFFAAAASNTYPTGSPIAAFIGSDYGPQHIYRLYISRNTTNQNQLTIKSGDLAIASTTIIGRSGSTTAVQNEGRVNQLGGRLRLPNTNLDIGETESNAWGNGAYNYQGGTLEVALEGGTGVRATAR